MNLPKVKTDNLVVQTLINETLIYNLTTNQAFCLNETATKVFNACDGETSFENLKAKYRFTDDLIYFALDELKSNNLIEGYGKNYFAGLSRREIIKKVGLASMITLPAIVGITAPSAVSAASVSSLYRDCPNGNSDCGSDAPNCNAVLNPGGDTSPVCCTSSTGSKRPGFQSTVSGYTSCPACYAAAAQDCCSGNFRPYSCANDGVLCTATCI